MKSMAQRGMENPERPSPGQRDGEATRLRPSSSVSAPRSPRPCWGSSGALSVRSKADPSLQRDRPSPVFTCGALCSGLGGGPVSTPNPKPLRPTNKTVLQPVSGSLRRVQEGLGGLEQGKFTPSRTQNDLSGGSRRSQPRHLSRPSPPPHRLRTQEP